MKRCMIILGLVASLATPLTACGDTSPSLSLGIDGQPTVGITKTVSPAELQRFSLHRMPIENVTVSAAAGANGGTNDFGFNVKGCTSRFALTSGDEGGAYTATANGRAVTTPNLTTSPETSMLALLAVVATSPSQYGCNSTKLRTELAKVGIKV